MEGREVRAQPYLRVSKMKTKPRGTEEISRACQRQDEKRKGRCGAGGLAVK